MIAPVVELLAEVRRLGVTLVAEGDRLRFAPRDRLPAELVGRLKAHKADVLAALAETPARGKPTAPAARTSEATVPDESEVVGGNPASNASIGDEAVVLGPDGWPVGTIDPFSVEPCGKCGSLELWENVFGDSRCMRCSPPIVSRRLAETCQRLRSAGRPEPNGQIRRTDVWKPSPKATPERGR